MPAKRKSTVKKLATYLDYANQHFEPQFTSEEASRIGGEILAAESVSIRMAAVILSRTKQELIEGFSQDKELLITMVDNLRDSEKFIKGLVEMNQSAVLRLLSVACCVVPENDSALKVA